MTTADQCDFRIISTVDTSKRCKPGWLQDKGWISTDIHLVSMDAL